VRLLRGKNMKNVFEFLSENLFQRPRNGVFLFKGLTDLKSNRKKDFFKLSFSFFARNISEKRKNPLHNNISLHKL